MTLSARRWGGNVEIVYSSDAVAVDLADSQLRSADISTVVIGRHGAGILPVLGEEAKLRLLVDASDVDRALEVLSESGVSRSMTEGDKSNSDVVEQGENDKEEN